MQKMENAEQVVQADGVADAERYGEDAEQLGHERARLAEAQPQAEEPVKNIS